MGPMTTEITELESFITLSRARKDLPDTVLDAVSVRLADLLDEREKLASNTPASRVYVQRLREFEAIKEALEANPLYTKEFRDSLLTQATRLCDHAERLVESDLQRL